MSRERLLRGGCSCGRNKYIVNIPQDSNEVAQVLFDDGHHHRRSQATPLSAWLRVPLLWYSSTTYAFFDDETHTSIRRVYTSPSEQSAKRHFCGFCGTPLSYWTESPSSEAEYISLTLGSLTVSDLRDLEDLGLLPKELLEDTENDEEKFENAVPFAGSSVLNGEWNEALPWFESMIEGSRLGKTRRSRGERRSGDGRVRVEWEIVEWTQEDGDVESVSSAKRKLGDVDDDDSKMEGTH